MRESGARIRDASRSSGGKAAGGAFESVIGIMTSLQSGAGVKAE